MSSSITIKDYVFSGRKDISGFQVDSQIVDEKPDHFHLRAVKISKRFLPDIVNKVINHIECYLIKIDLERRIYIIFKTFNSQSSSRNTRNHKERMNDIDCQSKYILKLDGFVVRGLSKHQS